MRCRTVDRDGSTYRLRDAPGPIPLPGRGGALMTDGADGGRTVRAVTAAGRDRYSNNPLNDQPVARCAA
jgi:hypothetical protein